MQAIYTTSLSRADSCDRSRRLAKFRVIFCGIPPNRTKRQTLHWRCRPILLPSYKFVWACKIIWLISNLLLRFRRNKTNGRSSPTVHISPPTTENQLRHSVPIVRSLLILLDTKARYFGCKPYNENNGKTPRSKLDWCFNDVKSRPMPDGRRCHVSASVMLDQEVQTNKISSYQLYFLYPAAIGFSKSHELVTFRTRGVDL